jgi:hypothetical protein
MDNNKAAFGERLSQLAYDLQQALGEAEELRAIYFDAGISDDVNAVAQPDDLVPDMVLDKNTALGLMTTLEQYSNFMNNVAVVTGDYSVWCNVAAQLRTP